MEITGGTGAPGPAGPAGPATKGQDANYLVWIDPSNSNKATAYNTHTGVNDYTGTTTDVVMASIMTALGSGGGVVKLSPDTHTWAATITPTAPLRVVGSGVATVVSVSGNITPFTLNGTDQAIEHMTIQGNGSTAHALTSAGATRMHVDWVRCTGFAGSPIVCTGTHTNSAIEHAQFDGNTAATDVDLSAATGVVLDRANIYQDGVNYAILLGAKCVARHCHLTSKSGAAANCAILVQGDDSAVELCELEWGNSNGNPAIWTAAATNRTRIIGNRITSDGTSGGIGVGGYGGAWTGAGTIVAENEVYDCTGDGILVSAASTNPGYPVVADNVVANTVSGAGGDFGTGIEVHSLGASIAGNTVVGSGGHGIFADTPYGTVADNICRLNGQTENTSAGICVVAQHTRVTDNQCLDNGINQTTIQGFGIIVRSDNAAAPTTGCRISGNLCTDTRSGASRTQHTGIYTYNGNATTDGNYYADNDVTNNVTSNVFDGGGSGGTGQTSAVYRHNPGYNPVGVSAVTVGASPWTYTAGNSPTTLYLSGGTVSGVTKGGVALPTSGAYALDPHDAVTVTYSAAPTATQDVH